MRPARPTLIALLIASALPVSSIAAAQQARSGAELLSAAERSFSDVPFGAPETTPGLTIIDKEHCEQWGECSYRDGDRVEHYFWEGELVVKTVRVEDVGGRQIDALGIGNARSQDAVLSLVGAFLPEAKIDCHDFDDDGTRTCSASLGEGWISLIFDSSRHLTEVRIDAFHFT